MIIGFTGTRGSIEGAQLEALAELFALIDGAGVRRVTLHHGCCVGADAVAVRLARRAPNWWIVGHPPENPWLIDVPAHDLSHERRAPQRYLVRNRAIVDACELLVACPRGPEERAGSGTWATIREARRRARRTLIVWPNGDVREPVAGQGCSPSAPH